MSCSNCQIHPERPFQSPGEDLALAEGLRDHPVLRAVPCPEGRPQFGIEENFYRCAKCGQLWCHAESDAPFRGSWQKVDE